MLIWLTATAIRAPLNGTVVSIDVTLGDPVHVGQPLLVLEAMKMENVIIAETSGVVQRVAVAGGDAVHEGQPLLLLAAADIGPVAITADTAIDLDHIRPDPGRSSAAATPAGLMRCASTP